MMTEGSNISAVFRGLRFVALCAWIGAHTFGLVHASDFAAHADDVPCQICQATTTVGAPPPHCAVVAESPTCHAPPRQFDGAAKRAAAPFSPHAPRGPPAVG